MPGGHKELAGLSLEDVLGSEGKSSLSPSPPQVLSRTPSQIRRSLWDIIREHERDDNRDRKAWRRFKDRLRRQHHAGTTRGRSAGVPVSDIPLRNSRSHTQKRNHHKGSRSVAFSEDCRVMAEEDFSRGDFDHQVCDWKTRSCCRPGMMDRTSARDSGAVQEASESDEPVTGSAPGKSSKMLPQMMRHNSTKMGSMRKDSIQSSAQSESSSLLGRDDPDFIGYGSEKGQSSRRTLVTSYDDRPLSAREAAASQEASEAEAAEAREEERNQGLFEQETTEDQEPLRFSLMDLLEETDRQMGYTGSSYMVGEGHDDDEENTKDEDGNHEEEAGERSCSVCRVKHKGAPFGSCRHSFCRLCSKELRVGNGNCPACNDFNLEIVQVF